MQKLIIIRGAPACGKSTIAERLRNFEKKIVWLKIDAFKGFFAADASEMLGVVHETAAATLEYLLRGRFFGSGGGYFPKT